MCFHQEAKLLAIDDDDVRDMVRSMLSLEPAARGSATDYAAYPLFPPYFGGFLHGFMATLLRTTHDEKVAMIAARQEEILGALGKTQHLGCILAIWVSFFSRPERYRCTQAAAKTVRESPGC